MFQTMVDMNNEGKPVDIVTLQARLKEMCIRDRFIDMYSDKYDRIVLSSDVDGRIAKYCDGTVIMYEESEFGELSAEDVYKRQGLGSPARKRESRVSEIESSKAVSRVPRDTRNLVGMSGDHSVRDVYKRQKYYQKCF